MEEPLKVSGAVRWKNTASTDDPRNKMRIIAIAILNDIQQAYCEYIKNGGPVRKGFLGKQMVESKKDWFPIADLEQIREKTG